MSTQQIVVAVVWAIMLLGVAYLIRDSYSKGHAGVAVALVPVFSVLAGLFIVYAANAFGIDIEQVRKLFGDDGDSEGITTIETSYRWCT
jgi:hypothetical protein